MNDIELYSYFASNATRFGRPLRLEEIKKNLPYFEVFKDQFGKYDIRSFNYENHDNAPRMELLEWYFKNRIFPNVRGNIKGFYNVELHDSYTYLNNDKDYKGCLVFSKFKYDIHPVLLPDPYSMCNWNGLYNKIPQDDIPWIDKKQKACFFGTTTGNRNPSHNERINLCLWSIKKRNILDCYITNISQMSVEDVKEYTKEQYNDIVTKPKSPLEQMQYKYNIVIDGNTCRYDIWNYFMNSVALKFPSKEQLWYYPMIQDNVHYISVTKDTIENIIHSTSKDTANFIIKNAQHTFKKIANPLTTQHYCTCLFEYMSENR